MYRVSSELYKHEWKFGITRNAVGTRAAGTRATAFSSSPKLSRVFVRGGWPRAELHYGSIIQNDSVYTISHAVRSSGEATKDPLKSEFLASFRCKCRALNVILLDICSDYLTIK